MHNAEIAQHFDELADLLEIQGANPFRVRAYRNAARIVGDLAEQVATVVGDPARKLDEIPGIGADLAAKIATLAQAGVLPQLEELRQQVPPGVLQMTRIPGLGPKKAAALHKELGLTTLEQLRAACEAGQVAALKGFGKKTQQAILEGLAQVATAGQRLLLAEVEPVALELVAALREVPGVGQVEPAGSFRRRRESVGDLDILVTADNSADAMQTLADHPRVAQVLSRGETKMRVRLKIGLEMDLRVVPKESYGAALQYFTGSKDHNIVMRRRAIERGLKLNEYGLFRDDKPVAGETEAGVYAALDLPCIPPELREGRHEFEWAEAGRLPRLIEPGDVQGDLHMHTTASDGAGSIREMAEAALARGLKYIAITDHSQRVSMANGLDATRLRAHWREIERVRAEVPGIEIWKGIECDILEDATLDLADDVLAEADWVVAVLHYGLKQPREQIMQRLLNAIRSPHVDAIGHLTGRMIGRRPGADMDVEAVLQELAREGKMLEINAHPSRLDVDDITAARAKELGIPLVINTDSHAVTGFDVLQYGVHQARRAGLEAADVANTLGPDAFRQLLQRRRPPR